MSCDRQQPGNIDCQNCKIKRLLQKDRSGTYYLEEGQAVEAGLKITKMPHDAWTSSPEQKTAECQRGGNGIIAVIED